MKFVTLYGKDRAGGLKIWEVSTQGNAITVLFGKLGGKMQSKTTYAESKNVGRANETSPDRQAEIEAEAKWVKQQKKGYFTTKEEALGYVNSMPMKAQNYNDYAHKVEFPCYVQPKLNGRRMLIDSEGNAQSKQGEENLIPEHWKADLRVLKSIGLLEHGLDGEVFTGYQKQGGLSLQEIGSAYLKPNENTNKLKLYVYDIPAKVSQLERTVMMNTLAHAVNACNTTSIVVVDTKVVDSDTEATKFYNYWLSDGAEGMVYRNKDAMYEYGKRSYNLIKRKPRLDAEAKVLSVEEDKNNEGVLTCQLENGITFECKMRVDSHPTINYRKHAESLTLIGKFITFEYEELSDAGKPTKAVGIGLRNVDEKTWEPLE